MPTTGHYCWPMMMMMVMRTTTVIMTVTALGLYTFVRGDLLFAMKTTIYPQVLQIIIDYDDSSTR